MAKQRKSKVMTPELATQYMTKVLARDLTHYDGFSNAVLSEFEYVEDAPVWAMELIKNNKVDKIALLDECQWTIVIYDGPFKPKPIVPMGQTYFRPSTPGGEGVGQYGEPIYNKNKEVCIMWRPMAQD